MAAAMRSFDTLRSYNTLKARGVSDVQAQALVEMIKEATESSIEHLATDAALQLAKSILSQDILNLRTEVKQDILDLRNELKQDMLDLRNELKQDILDLRNELKQDMSDLRNELKQDISDLRSEVKLDISNLRNELRQDIMEGRAETALVKADVQFLKRLYFSGTAATLMGIALLFLQRH